MKQIIIVAVDEQGVIGRSDNSFMWKLSDDLKHFKELTLGHPMIMGHTTYTAIGRLLTGRHTIILSRSKELIIEGASIVSTIDAALTEAKKYDDVVFIVGGEEVYRQFLPTADLLYVSEVHADVGGDKQFFYDVKEWQEIEKTTHRADENNTFDFTIRKFKAVR